MKIAYVLVSDNDDFYYEQAVGSLLSLKDKMPTMKATLVVDDKTARTLTGSRSQIVQLVDEMKVIDFSPEMPPMLRSRHLKTSLRRILQGDFLYVDVDTVWADSIDEEILKYDVMGVPDSHRPYRDFLKIRFDQSLEKLGFFRDFEYLINGGVFFMKDSPVAYEFSDKWHLLWTKCCEQGIFTDQQSLNQTCHDMGNVVKFLPDIYNAQIDYSIKYVANAKLIHYFSCIREEKSEAYLLKKKSFWENVKKNGFATDSLSVLMNPKEAWLPGSYVFASDFIQEKKIVFKEPCISLLVTMAESSKLICRQALNVLNCVAKWLFFLRKFFK